MRSRGYESAKGFRPEVEKQMLEAQRNDDRWLRALKVGDEVKDFRTCRDGSCERLGETVEYTDVLASVYPTRDGVSTTWLSKCSCKLNGDRDGKPEEAKKSQRPSQSGGAKVRRIGR